MEPENKNDRSIAELVDALFQTHRRPDGKEYTYQEVSNGINGELDPSYITKVRKGIIKNPGRDALKLLCLFFHVPASYFFPELDSLAAPEGDPEQQKKDNIRMALRSAGLTPEAQAHVESLIDMLRQKKDNPRD
jgi:transcriptional regulator with XRE-family HTH domain